MKKQVKPLKTQSRQRLRLFFLFCDSSHDPLCTSSDRDVIDAADDPFSSFRCTAVEKRFQNIGSRGTAAIVVMGRSGDKKDSLVERLKSNEMLRSRLIFVSSM